ncbi:transmembrane protein 131 isoform X2 [Protopterus annectens]|uniref:transmembrane protein 131 isoform X2 n=1 Tax=Protopterus annectens TaxID=7888 RepID=UPI001CFA7BE2|nr:transmembrane protein 131 isoform X2 [Protopterus annectens]
MAKRQRLDLCPFLIASRTSRSATTALFGYIHLFIGIVHMVQAEKEAFIQSENILEVLRFDEGLLQTDTGIDLSSYQQKSASLHRGNCRPIRFEPPMLDFHEQPVGMPKMEKVYLHNPSSEETIILLSISATTSHFHASFFQNGKITPGGNTSFDVVFLARVVGNVENTLFINTSHHGVFTYQVFGVGIPNPYRLRPFIGARVPVNSSFSPLITIHNPHSEPLQVVEMYSSGGDLHLELPTGQQGGTKKLWEIPPYETRGVMRASFSSRDADNHTAFIRIKTNVSDNTEFIILPVEVEVSAAPGIYSSIEMLDFGTLRTQDVPKILNLHLLNSGTKDVPITSIRPTPPNEAVTVDFKPITLKATESKYTKVASISFDASKAKKTSQFSGKIIVKAKEKSYSKLEIPYQVEVLEGYLGFDHVTTLFHIRDSPADPVERSIHLINTFNFAVLIHNVSLPEEGKTMFKVLNFSEPVLIPPHQSQYIFSLLFSPSSSSIHIDSNILLITNASKFHLPVRAYTGFLDYFILPPNQKERIIDFGILSATEASSILFTVVNSNPIELAVKSWHVIGESLSVELLTSEKHSKNIMLDGLPDVENYTASDQSSVILASGYYAVFRVTLDTKALEGAYSGAIQITTDYEILTIPVSAVIAVGSLTCTPSNIVLPVSFPGKIVHQNLNIMSSFSQKVKLLRIRSLAEDVRFYYKRLRSNREDLEAKKKSKIANIYFDASLQCNDHCYVGLPFLSKSESKMQHSLAMQEDVWDSDWDVHEQLYKKWTEVEKTGHIIHAQFEVDTDLQKSVQAKVTAELIWPSLINTTHHINFPLTNKNSSSEEEVILENPADVPVYVQLLPLLLYSNAFIFTDKLIERLKLSRFSNIDSKSLAFQVFSNNTQAAKIRSGFTEGLTRHSVLNVILKPGERRSVKIRFTPFHNETETSLIIIRNNLTVMDAILVQGQGTTESLKVGGKPVGPGNFLRFKITEASLRDCSDRVRIKEPNFTLKRIFKVENAGQLPVYVKSLEISGYACEGYGFKVDNCEEFALKPNASKDIVILFTPDFTASRVIRELKLVTAGGSEFVFVLNASLPYHMLAACAESLPRPNWELGLYIIISGIMSFLFLLVIGTAYLEAQGIWEPFRRRLSLEASNPPFDLGRPFDLRRIVGISSDGNLNTFGSDSNSNSTRGLYGTESSSLKSSLGTQRQCSNVTSQVHSNRNSTDTESAKSKNISNSTSRTASQISSNQTSNRTNSIVSETTVIQSQQNRRFRSGKQIQQACQQQTVVSQEPHLQQLSTVSQSQQQQEQTENTTLLQATQFSSPHINCSNSRHSSEDSDITSLMEVMDKDLDQPDTTSCDVFTEQPSSPTEKSKGKLKLPFKSKLEKKRRDKRGKGRQQEDELKDMLADDDSSSTTTETSNPDTEALLKEEPEKKKEAQPPPEKLKEENEIVFQVKPKYRKSFGNKKGSQTDVKASSLELPYTTPLENKQRKSLATKLSLHQVSSSSSKLRNLPKSRGPNSKLSDGRPSVPFKLFSCSSGLELGNTSSSEGEKDSSPPEWDSAPMPCQDSSEDSLYQLSLQTRSADALFRQMSPPPPSPSPPPLFRLSPRGSYSGPVNYSEPSSKAQNSKQKLTKASSLPGKNGNPTFAAVTAGYDKSPGGCGPVKNSTSMSSLSGATSISQAPSLDSDGSDSSGLWSPISNPGSPEFCPQNSFSAFGPNQINLTGAVLGTLGLSKPSYSQDSHRSWSEFDPLPSPLWDKPSSEPLTPWPAGSGSPTHPAASLLGSSTGLWSPTIPFHDSIWSNSADSGLPFATSSAASTLSTSELAGSENPMGNRVEDICRRIWSPTVRRRSSNPWFSASNFPLEK